MTESYKTPLKYTKIKESQSFETVRTLENTSVCLITYANDNFYLNLPQVVDKTTGKYEIKDPVFQRWHNIKRIDFNGWWICETNNFVKEIKFKHFNTNRYMKINTDNPESPIEYTKSKKKASKFKLEPCNHSKVDYNMVTEKVCFKLKLVQEKDQKPIFLRIESVSEESLFDEDITRNKKKVHIGEEDDISKYDTFHMIFPKEDEYIELALCMDSKRYLESFVNKLKLSDNKIESLEDWKSGIGKVLFTV